MAGLVPAVHAFYSSRQGKSWMPGARPGMTNQRFRAPVLAGRRDIDDREPGNAASDMCGMRRPDVASSRP